MLVRRVNVNNKSSIYAWAWWVNILVPGFLGARGPLFQFKLSVRNDFFQIIKCSLVCTLKHLLAEFCKFCYSFVDCDSGHRLHWIVAMLNLTRPCEQLLNKMVPWFLNTGYGIIPSFAYARGLISNSEVYIIIPHG